MRRECGNAPTSSSGNFRSGPSSRHLCFSAYTLCGINWWWIRGAFTAANGCMPRAITFSNTCAVAVIMRGPPEARALCKYKHRLLDHTVPVHYGCRRRRSGSIHFSA